MLSQLDQQRLVLWQFCDSWPTDVITIFWSYVTESFYCSHEWQYTDVIHDNMLYFASFAFGPNSQEARRHYTITLKQFNSEATAIIRCINQTTWKALYLCASWQYVILCFVWLRREVLLARGFIGAMPLYCRNGSLDPVIVRWLMTKYLLGQHDSRIDLPYKSSGCHRSQPMKEAFEKILLQ